MRFLVFLSLFSVAISSYGKFTVCTATINSADEREEFQKHLKGKGFDFVELTDFAGQEGDTEWFSKACDSGVRCDVLMISGHFGGSFFPEGKSWPGLSTETMESKSCSGKCDGIFGQPSEVFLMGCNTLATKEQDHRSPEEYLEVLLADGIDPATAERVVQARYGALGESYKERMQRVFLGVPHIYGFDSVGPAGSTVRPFLRRYFKRIGDYKKHISNIQANQINQSVANINKAVESPRNRILAKVMSNTAFAQCSGVQDGNNEESIKRNKICEMLDKDRPIEDRIRTAHSLLKEDYLNYLPSVLSFFQRESGYIHSNEAQTALEEIKSDSALKAEIQQLLPSLKSSPRIHLDILKLKRDIGWFTPQEHDKEAKGVLKRVLKTLRAEDAEVICRNSYLIGEVEAKDINEKALKDMRILSIMGCLTTKDQQITRSILDQYKKYDVNGRTGAMYILGSLPGYQDEIIKYANEGRRSSQKYMKEAAYGVSFLKNIDNKGDQFGKWLAQNGRADVVISNLNKVDFIPSDDLFKVLVEKAGSYELSSLTSSLPLDSALWPQIINRANQNEGDRLNIASAIAVDDKVNVVTAEWAVEKISDSAYELSAEGYYADILSQYSLNKDQVRRLSLRLKGLVDRGADDVSPDGVMTSRDMRPAYIRQILLANEYELDAEFVKRYIDGRPITNYKCKRLDENAYGCG